jgi:hypothetical protein
VKPGNFADVIAVCNFKVARVTRTTRTKYIPLSVCLRILAASAIEGERGFEGDIESMQA